MNATAKTQITTGNCYSHLNTRYINSTQGTSSGTSSFEDEPLAEFVHLAFTRMPGESHCRQLGSLLLCLCDVFEVLINSSLCLSIYAPVLKQPSNTGFLALFL